MNDISTWLLIGIGLVTMMIIPISPQMQYLEAVTDKELIECSNILGNLGEDTHSLDIDAGIAIFQNGTKMTCEDLKELWINEKEFRQYVKDYDAEATANELNQLTGGQELTSASTLDEFNMSELTSGPELTNGSLMNSDDQGAPLVMICLEPGLANTDPDDKWKCRFYVFDDIDLSNSNIDLQNDFKEENTFNYGE